MPESLTLVETLQQLDHMVGQTVSIVFGSNDVGTFPMFLLRGVLRRSDDIGAATFRIVSGGDDHSRFAIPAALFESGRWDERDEVLWIMTTLGVMQISTRDLAAGISKHR